ncbi:SH3 domain-containing protein [Nitratireductor sp. StC3]|uniref:SH3 domain-containing protein n=1 Tax=Nitratireductor sp. StC3 TaxID=2126741 RepID=UPI0011B212A3|nr:SH3 domain-containing protein [Nitratireductor sp. StC3]
MTRYTLNDTDRGGPIAPSPFDEPITVFQSQPVFGGQKGLALPALFATVLIGAGLAVGIIAMSGEPTSADTGAYPGKLALADVKPAPPQETAVDADAGTTAAIAPDEGSAQTPPVVSARAAPDEEPLSKDNPRWAAATGGVAAKAAIAALAGDDARADEVSAPDALAYLPGAAKPALTIEPEPRDQPPGETQEKNPAEASEVSEPRASAPAATPAAQSTGRITTAVNMRRGPANGAGIISVIPKGAKVGIVACKAWCQVVHDGRTGYIFKRFVRQQAGAAAKKNGATAESAATQTSELATLKSVHRGGR